MEKTQCQKILIDEESMHMHTKEWIKFEEIWCGQTNLHAKYEKW